MLSIFEHGAMVQKNIEVVMHGASWFFEFASIHLHRHWVMSLDRIIWYSGSPQKMNQLIETKETDSGWAKEIRIARNAFAIPQNRELRLGNSRNMCMIEINLASRIYIGIKTMRLGRLWRRGRNCGKIQ